MKSQKNIFIPIKIFIFLSILTGIIYPLLITLIAQTVFPRQSNGSLVTIENKIMGSELISQNFNDQKYFWPRPSAVNYDSKSSGGTNLSVTSKQLLVNYKANIQRYGSQEKIPPTDLLFASASGLDPDISPEAAYYQLERIAKARNLSQDFIKRVIENNYENRQLTILGEPRVNVLKLNIALDMIPAK